MMLILTAITDYLGLKDAWLAPGAVRNYIWNVLSGASGFDTETDLDVVFYNPEMPYEETLAIQESLQQAYPTYAWELKNQVAMYRHSPETTGYASARDAISKYPETATAVALRLVDNQLELFAPYGLEVISRFEIHPTPHFKVSSKRMAVYRQRLSKKDWVKKWPQIRIYQD